MRKSVNDLTEKYKKGSRLSASDMNALIRAVKEDAARFDKLGVEGAGSHRSYSAELIPYKNASGEVIPPGAILVGEEETTAIRHQLQATKPATVWKWIWYVNSMQYVASGKSGWCSVATDRTLIRTTGTITPGMFVGPQANSFIGIGNRNGFMCVGKTRTIQTLQFTPCVQVFPKEFYGKPTGAFAVNAADGVITLWDAAFAGSLTFTLSDVNIRTRAMTATTRVSGNVVGGEVSAFPIDCTDS